MKNLFICGTPLHCLIVSRIIEIEKLSSQDNEVLYLSYKNKDQTIHKQYYSRLSDLAKNSNFIEINRRIFFYFYLLKKMFNKKMFNSVYVANINMPIVHFILSIIRFNYLYSYDDGVGNIVSGSDLYVRKQTLKIIIRDIIYFCFGNRFSLQKVRKITNKHYTIYHNMENIHNNLCYLDIFHRKEVITNNGSRSASCIVLLGTVYSEVVENKNDKLVLIKLIQKFINKSLYPVIYIPHPRDIENYFKNVTYCFNHEIAEFELSKLVGSYNDITLCGFVSTVQFNVMNYPNIKNFYFHSELLRINVLNLYNKVGITFNFTEINLDAIGS